jgi:thioredoxin reductase (NADPH)
MLPLAWQLTRLPRVLEPNLPGVFAVGDVRSGECDALASAVGEEAIAIHLVHWALAEF